MRRTCRIEGASGLTCPPLSRRCPFPAVPPAHSLSRHSFLPLFLCQTSIMVAIPRSILFGALGSVVPVEKRSATPHLPTGWSYRNCYKDSESARLLPVQLYSGIANTVGSCLDRCNRAGYDFAGVEYGEECWCGSSLSTSAQVGSCAKPCSGQSS